MSTYSGEVEQQSTSNKTSIAMLSSQIDTSIAQIASIRSMLFSNIQCYDDFTKLRQSLGKILYETETSISFLLKKVAELTLHFNSLTSELNKSSIINEELDNKLSSTYELIEEMKYNQDILDSQVKYYKKQCLEKDKYIIYLKERMASTEGHSEISYINYNNITLPERIKREKVSSEVKENINNDYGYDYKEDTNHNINSLSVSFNNNTKEEVKENIERKVTIGRKIQNVMSNLCHCDSKIVDLLTKKYGGEVIQKISSGDIDYETVDKVEKDIYKEKENVLFRSQTMKEETKKYLRDKTEKNTMKGWERLKGYLKLGKEDKAINRLHTMK